jgi:hypothetical protein
MNNEEDRDVVAEQIPFSLLRVYKPRTPRGVSAESPRHGAAGVIDVLGDALVIKVIGIFS